MEFSLVSNNCYAVPIGANFLYRNPFPNFNSRFPGFACQPGIELVATDDAQGVALGYGNRQASAGKVEVRSGRVYMQDFAHVQAETFQDHLCIGYQGSGAQLGARIVRLFQKQDAGNPLRG